MRRTSPEPDREKRSTTTRAQDRRRGEPTSDGEHGLVESLHRAVGNRAVQRLHNRGELQTKLEVGSPDDRYEREAEQVAERVMRTPTASRTDSSPQESSHSHASNGDTATTDEQRIRSLDGGGKPLPESVRSFFEPQFGRDFSTVRAHTGPEADAAARSINAEAFTHGQDVVFAKGRYRPRMAEGRRLLAHELTHVVQQGGAGGASQTIQRQATDETEQSPGVELDSWADLYSRGGTSTLDGGTLVGSVYFATDKHELDSQDRDALERLRQDISTALLERRFDVEFKGYADKRGGETYNVDLASRRTASVADFFSPLEDLAYTEGYSATQTTFGEFTTKQRGETAAELAAYRRVDIVVKPPISNPIERPKRKKQKREKPTSKKWKARLWGSASGEILIGVAVATLEIVDVTNGRRMYYQFRGGGFGFGLIGASGKSSWKHFETSEPIDITDFEGGAVHGGLAVGGGEWTGSVGIETLLLSGPQQAGANSVELEWSGLGEAWAAGGGVEMGTLVPGTEPEEVSGGGPPDLQISE